MRLTHNIKLFLTLTLIIIYHLLFFFFKFDFINDREFQHASQVYYLTNNSRIGADYPGHAETIMPAIYYSLINKILGFKLNNDIIKIFQILYYDNLITMFLFYTLSIIFLYIIGKRIFYDDNHALLAGIISVSILYRIPVYTRAIFTEILYILLLVYLLTDIGQVVKSNNIIIYIIIFYVIVASDPAHGFVLLLSLVTSLVILFTFKKFVNKYILSNNSLKLYRLIFIVFTLIFFFYYTSNLFFKGFVDLISHIYELIVKSMETPSSSLQSNIVTYTDLYVISYTKRIIDYFLLLGLILGYIIVFLLIIYKNKKMMNRDLFSQSVCKSVNIVNIIILFSFFIVNLLILLLRGYRFTIVPLIAILTSTILCPNNYMSTEYFKTYLVAIKRFFKYTNYLRIIIIFYILFSIVISPFITIILYPKYNISYGEINELEFINYYNFDKGMNIGAFVSCWTFPTLYELLLNIKLYNIHFIMLKNQYIDMVYINNINYIIISVQITECYNTISNANNIINEIITNLTVKYNGSMIYNGYDYDIIINKK